MAREYTVRIAIKTRLSIAMRTNSRKCVRYEVLLGGWPVYQCGSAATLREAFGHGRLQEVLAGGLLERLKVTRYKTLFEAPVCGVVPGSIRYTGTHSDLIMYINGYTGMYAYGREYLSECGS